MIRLTILIAATAMGMSTVNADQPLTKAEVAEAARAGVTFVDNAYIAARRAENADLLLIDVRSQQEFELARIPGAISIPRGTAEFQIAEQVRDADQEIILYCRTGNRAALVKKALDVQGYRNVSVHGGFESWSDAGLPVENDLGRLVVIGEEDGDAH